MRKFNSSLQLDLSKIFPTKRKIYMNIKEFKILADAIRSGIKNEHGYKATTDITDLRLRKWPIVIRFVDQENRNSFESSLRNIINPNLLTQMKIKHLTPSDNGVN